MIYKIQQPKFPDKVAEGRHLGLFWCTCHRFLLDYFLVSAESLWLIRLLNWQNDRGEVPGLRAWQATSSADSKIEA